MKGENIIKTEISTQDWLPFDKVLENGMIISKNHYIKIVRILPINYDLKSTLEKEAILSSYKLFLKTCDFNVQILIQSKKEDLSKHILRVIQLNEMESSSKVKEISENYIEFIKNKNEENKSSSKNFYIIIKYSLDNSQKDLEEVKNQQNMAVHFLNECYFKIKETLSRCGNLIYDVNSKIETEKILCSFFNPNMRK